MLACILKILYFIKHLINNKTFVLKAKHIHRHTKYDIKGSLGNSGICNESAQKRNPVKYITVAYKAGGNIRKRI